MDTPIRLGLAANRYQFWLLVLVNAFVGAMAGLERSILPGFGVEIFHISAQSALLSFIIAFGIAKAIANYFVSRLNTRFTKKTILITGWLFALPVPFLLMYAPTWYWVLLANILLGINQGLAWSATILMKIDLVGPQKRGLAMGINEFAGYLAVGLASWLAGGLAAQYGYAWYPFVPGVFFAWAGLLLTVFLVKDTASHVQLEAGNSSLPIFKNTWKQTSGQHRNIGTVTLNGIVNNMNDAVVWGIVPVLLVQKGLTVLETGVVVSVYPIVWGVLQLFTGSMGDHYCKKQVITIGMLLQAAAIAIMALAGNFIFLLFAAIILGAGTALVYPNFITVIAENTHPSQRAATISIFRFWRDNGYVVGALLAGVLADTIGMEAAILLIAALTAGAGLLAHFRMCCTRKKWYPSEDCAVPAL